MNDSNFDYCGRGFDSRRLHHLLEDKMKLTEAQIKQVVNSSIEAKRKQKVHRLTELEIRQAVRWHIQTGKPINEGLLDMLKGALGGLFDAFSGAFSGALDSAASAFGEKREKKRQGLMSALGLDDVPDMEDLAPGKNDNDGFLMVMYVGSMAQSIGWAKDEMAKIADIESPYPPTDGSDAEEFMGIFGPKWGSAAEATGYIAQASKEVSKHIPEARNIQKELEAAGEDPVATLEAAKNGVDFWTGTIIPQLKDMGANDKALEKADPYMKSQVQESIFELEDMGEHFASINSVIEDLLPKWIEARDATEEEVPEEEQAEAAEEAAEEGGGSDEAIDAAGEEDAIGGEIVAGPDDDGGDDSDEPEEKPKTEAVLWNKADKIILTEKQLKRLVRKLIVN